MTMMECTSRDCTHDDDVFICKCGGFCLRKRGIFTGALFLTTARLNFAATSSSRVVRVFTRFGSRCSEKVTIAFCCSEKLSICPTKFRCSEKPSVHFAILRVFAIFFYFIYTLVEYGLPTCLGIIYLSLE
ncbi:Uncharacterized protein TCM_028188 [Theobroma cacao]|uniref:Uncharacterized protein n=1 Tax=Theobroma cacao TaxID=3641 RepID=A0A061GHD7_THECC|nr:Uncharacterized protein TCM_028188 [Theobroma cacao]